MSRTMACDQTKTYRGRDSQGQMRTMMKCTLGRFFDAPRHRVKRLKRGKHACALCAWKIRMEDGE